MISKKYVTLAMLTALATELKTARLSNQQHLVAANQALFEAKTPSPLLVNLLQRQPPENAF